MSEVTDFAEDSKEQLVSDMKVVVSDAEEILRETKGVAGEKIAELRERIAVRLRDAGLKLSLDRDFWHTPPADALFLHRKLGGLYLLAARLGARVDVGRLAEPWLG